MILADRKRLTIDPDRGVIADTYSGLYIMPESRAEKGPSFFKAGAYSLTLYLLSTCILIGAKLMFVGLFNPGDVPTPTMETFTKDMESWETTARGVNAFEKNGKF